LSGVLESGKEGLRKIRLPEGPDDFFILHEAEKGFHHIFDTDSQFECDPRFG
jgi:hypothetical protein